MEQEIVINISSSDNNHVPLVWLLSDFLNHTGFRVDLNSSSLYHQTEEELHALLESIPTALDGMIGNNSIKITINEV